MVERRGSERRETDQSTTYRLTRMEEDVRELKQDFAELRDDFREISRKIDKAFSDEGVIGQLNKRVGAFEIDKLSWKRVITIFGAIGTLLGTLGMGVYQVLDRFLPK